MIDQFSTLRWASIPVGIGCGWGVHLLAGLLDRQPVMHPAWLEIALLPLLAPAVFLSGRYALRKNHRRLVGLPRSERGHDVSHAFNTQLTSDAAVFMGFCAVTSFFGGLIALLWRAGANSWS